MSHLLFTSFARLEGSRGLASRRVGRTLSPARSWCRTTSSCNFIGTPSPGMNAGSRRDPLRRCSSRRMRSPTRSNGGNGGMVKGFSFLGALLLFHPRANEPLTSSATFNVVLSGSGGALSDARALIGHKLVAKNMQEVSFVSSRRYILIY